jgi:hypothetical protein
MRRLEERNTTGGGGVSGGGDRRTQAWKMRTCAYRQEDLGREKEETRLKTESLSL